MRLNTVDSSKEPWTKRVLGALVVVLLAAVPALGLTTLGPGFFPLRQLGKDGPGTEPDVGVSNWLFTFDAPMATLQRVRPAEAKDVRTLSEGDGTAREEVLLLSDWRFTQSFQEDLSAILAADLSYVQSFHAGPLFTFLTYEEILQSQVQTFQNLSPAEKLLLLSDWRFTQSFQEDLSAIRAADLNYAQSFHAGSLFTFLIYEEILQLQAQAFQNLSPAQKLLLLVIVDRYTHRQRPPQSPHQ